MKKVLMKDGKNYALNEAQIVVDTHPSTHLVGLFIHLLRHQGHKTKDTCILLYQLGLGRCVRNNQGFIPQIRDSLIFQGRWPKPGIRHSTSVSN